MPTILDPFDTKVFKENPLRFTVVCTDIRTGKPVYHEIKNGDALEMCIRDRIYNWVKKYESNGEDALEDSVVNVNLKSS